MAVMVAEEQQEEEEQQQEGEEEEEEEDEVVIEVMVVVEEDEAVGAAGGGGSVWLFGGCVCLWVGSGGHLSPSVSRGQRSAMKPPKFERSGNSAATTRESPQHACMAAVFDACTKEEGKAASGKNSFSHLQDKGKLPL